MVCSDEVTFLSTGTVGFEDRRIASDRRRRTLHALVVGGYRGRRRRVRRQESSGIADIDWYPARCFAAVLLILLLSCIDSVNTLALLTRGFIEVNPLMRALIDHGAADFTLIKFGLTAFSLTMLIVLTRVRAFGGFPVAGILYICVALYAGLVGYEFWMLNGFTLFD